MHDDESGTCGQWGEYGQLLDPDVLLGGLVGDDAGHEKPGLLPDLGVQVGADFDDVVRLPMVECAPVIVCLRAFGHGDAPGGSGSARSRVPRVCAAAGCRCMSIGEGLRAHAHELVVRGRGTCSLPLISGGQPSGPAIRPLAPTGGRMTDDAACVVWRAYGRPCAAAGPAT